MEERQRRSRLAYRDDCVLRERRGDVAEVREYDRPLHLSSRRRDDTEALRQNTELPTLEHVQNGFLPFALRFDVPSILARRETVAHVHTHEDACTRVRRNASADL